MDLRRSIREMETIECRGGESKPIHTFPNCQLYGEEKSDSTEPHQTPSLTPAGPG